VAFGAIDGCPPGSLFESRRALAEAGIHRHLQAGICGRAEEGAESVVLSGGYVDDDDLGDVVLYTGAGGRDPASGRQVADQQLNRANLALANGLRHGLPVRVIRGASPHVYDPPSSGYRYDGLYIVTDYWSEVGADGFRVWRFRLERVPGDMGGRVREEGAVYAPAPRAEVRIQRIVRSSAVADRVKRVHDYRCQVCEEALPTPAGPYAEAAHIRPLGRPHDGPDVITNVLCLCPNHHVLFDLLQFTVRDDLSLQGIDGRLRTHDRHPIGHEHLRYHRELAGAAG
jgi:putative restriction endonuclease